MTVSIKLTDRQFVRLQRIRKAYAERGLHYTLTEVFQIVVRTHAKDFIDRELDRVEDQLFNKIRGRMVGRWEDVE